MALQVLGAAVKILTILGTRPEIIRLSRIIPKLDVLADQVLVDTGQNYDPKLSDVFFRELGVRVPNYSLGARGSFAEQAGVIFREVERVLLKEKPDRFLVLGDTNSSLAAIVAKRMGIPVYHMEAGNRCYDDRVPEEVNRRLIDHSSDVWMPYTERSRQNLLREGIAGEKIYVTGNPILEVLEHYEPQIAGSRALDALNIETGRYFLVTMHRTENVDIEPRLRTLVAALEQLHREHKVPIIVSTHPHTQRRMAEAGLKGSGEQIRFLPPFGLFDFVNLERNALCVLSDSGTVQEECCIFHVRNITLRDVTERPETVECGSNVLAGANLDVILRCMRAALEQETDWRVPPEYLARNVSGTVVNLVLGWRE